MKDEKNKDKVENGENAIEVKNLWKQFTISHEKISSLKEGVINFLRRSRVNNENIWALKKVSFDVKKGECIGIIGVNGSGKTTLLRVLSNILPPTKGEVKIKGKIAPLLNLSIGFEPELTAKENLYLYGSLMGLSKEGLDKKYQDIVNFSELDGYMDTKLKNFSSGMELRLGFSTAVNVDADILLVDEFLAVGDIGFQKKCLEKMEELKSKGKTILLVTQNIDHVKKICDKAIFLDNGSIKAIGEVEEITNLYENYVFKKNVTAVGSKGKTLDGKLLLKEMSLYDFRGKNNTFSSGDKFIVSMTFESMELIKNPAISMWAKKNGGVFEILKNGRIKYENGKPYTELIGKATVKAIFDYMPLEPGTYELMIYVSSLKNNRIIYPESKKKILFEIIKPKTEEIFDSYLPDRSKISWDLIIESENLDEIKNDRKAVPHIWATEKISKHDKIKTLDLPRMGPWDRNHWYKSGGTRHGYGRVSILDVKILDKVGRENVVFNNKEDIKIKIFYFAEARVKNPIFNITIFGQKNREPLVLNTKDEKIIESINGRGVISLKINSNILKKDLYKVSAGVFAYHPKHPKEFYMRDYPFDCFYQFFEFKVV